MTKHNSPDSDRPRTQKFEDSRAHAAAARRPATQLDDKTSGHSLQASAHVTTAISQADGAA